jgi:hypothetical protein
MKTRISISGVLLASAAFISATAAWGQIPSNPAVFSPPQSQATGGGGGAGVTVVTTNGWVVITQDGKRVYAGPFAGTVTNHTGTINGVEQAAVYDDGILLWESAPGVGHQLQPPPAPSGQFGLSPGPATPFLPSMPSLGQHANSGISVSTVNGQSVVSLNGKEIYRGPATGAVSSRSWNVNGVEYSAVFDGDKVLWENVPGAARQLQSQSGGIGGGGMDLSQFSEQHRQAFERMVEAQRQFMQGQGGMVLGTNFSMSGGSARGMSGGGSFGSSGGSAQGSSGGFSSGGSSGQSFGSSGVRSNGDRSGFGSPMLPGQPLPVTLPQNSESSISIKTVNGSTVIIYQGREFSVGPTKGSLSVKTKSTQGTDFAAAFEGDRVIWENVPGAAQKVK